MSRCWSTQRFALVGLVFAFEPALGGTAPDIATFSVREMTALHTIEEQRLSSDGHYIAYVERTIAGDGGRRPRHIMLLETPRQTAPRKLFGEFSRTFEPRWSMAAGEPRMAFFGEGTTGAAPARTSRQLWLYTPRTGEKRRIAQDLRGAGQLEWVSDTSRVSFVRALDAPASAADAPRVVDTRAPAARLWVIDTRDGSAAPISPENLSVRRYAWSPDGLIAVVAAVPNDGPADAEHILLIPRSGAAPRLLMAAHDDTISLAWAPDGQTIAWLGREHAPGSGQIILTDTAGKSETLLADFPGSVVWLGYRPDGRLVMAALQGVRMGVYSFRVDGSDLRTEYDPQVWAPGTLCGEELSRFALSFSRDGSRISATVSGPHEPGNVVAGRWRKPLQRVTDLNPQVRGWAMGSLETVKWQARDGLDLEGLLLKPPGWEAGRRYPAIVNPHGGPRRSWWAGWLFTASAWAQHFASRGYLVFLPNPRGSEGYGAEFVRANRADLGGEDLRDVLSGVDVLVGAGLADPGRLAIAGWSYGGYLTARSITQTDRFKAAIVGAGVTNLLSFEGAGGSPQWSRTFWRDPLTPYLNPQILLERSPVFHAERVRTPTLLFHGTADDKVPPAQMFEFLTALRTLSVPVEAVEYPEAGHGLTDAAQIQDLYARMDAWLDRYLGP